MNHEETLCSIALTQIPGIGLVTAHQLINALGSAEAVFKNRKDLMEMVPGVTGRLVERLENVEVFRRAELEMNFAEKNHIACIPFFDERYPSRLRECEDAPLCLFYRGVANLNALHMVSMVGTRQATPYGQDLCARFVAQLAELCPDVIIVSGLAYGVDIHAHRAALENDLQTIGVLAHGLDRIYPSVHRRTAAEMLEQGGLLTEFMSGTNPDRQNFVKRNRIVAGMCDATIVVESAVKGGGLITAELAESYHRDCFAFPGRTSDEFSVGCNNLIRSNRAGLITSAADFVEAMNWQTEPQQRPRAVQRELFPELSEEEETIIRLLRKSPDGMQINTLVVAANIPIQRMSALLFELEMKGLVRTMAGGVYRLIG